jgi:capsular exopolysaccharide synthesis family protein
VLATIPREKGDKVVLLSPDDTRHAFAEAFRALRSSLLFIETAGKPPTAFLVTSAVPNEGKTTVASNLALAMAFSGANVLLVDADLRRGVMENAFGVERGAGLTDVLSGDIPWREAVAPTAVKGLNLLQRGTKRGHPGELFLGPHTDKFLADIYRSYDYVIFDSCPVMAADDTASLAPKIDATLLVFRFGFSSARASAKTLAQLRVRRANVLGVICNDLGEAVQEYYYHRYPEYYAAVGGAGDGR